MNSKAPFRSLLMSVGVFLLPCLPAAAQATNAAPAPAATPPSARGAPAAPGLDFGNYSSAVLTNKAWEALGNKNYPAVLAYTGKCVDMYGAKAVEMQGMLKAPAPKDHAFDEWALNDVGTCYFIKGKALDDQGDKKGAMEAYKYLVDKLSFSQCWDPKGWFWSPADAARKRLAELQFDAQ